LKLDSDDDWATASINTKINDQDQQIITKNNDQDQQINNKNNGDW